MSEVPHGLDSYPPDQGDVIMCAKQFWSDPVLSQPPQVVLPKAMLAHLSKGPTEPMPRKKMCHRQLKEYRKTADQAEKMPWQMKAGALYLRTWCNQNELDQTGHLPELGFVLSAAGRVLGASTTQARACTSDWKNYAPQHPTQITAELHKKKRGISTVEQTAEQHTKRGISTVEQHKRFRISRKMPVIILPAGDDAIPAGPHENAEDSRPAPVHAQEERAAEAQAAPVLVLGCATCRGAARGCKTCRNPNFRGRRGPRP